MEPFVSTNKDEVKPQPPLNGRIEKNPEEEAKSRHAVTIRKGLPEVFSFFRDFKNLPSFLHSHIQIKMLSEKRSHWILQLKSGGTLEWKLEIVQEVPGQLIAWRSLEGSAVETAGTLHFEKAPADRGTVVHLAMDYSMPGGKLTELALLFTGESPELVITRSLRWLKAYLETGEIPTIEGQPNGREERSTTPPSSQSSTHSATHSPSVKH